MTVNTVFDGAMLIATEQAASAAQSAADAAWWAVGVNGLVVAVAIGTTFFQEWRVKKRVEASNKALHQGAVDTLRQGWIAIDEAVQGFSAAGYVNPGLLREPAAKVERARRLLKLFVAREVDPKILIGLLQMDDHLATVENQLEFAITRSQLGSLENAPFNARLGPISLAAELLFISLA